MFIDINRQTYKFRVEQNLSTYKKILDFFWFNVLDLCIKFARILYLKNFYRCFERFKTDTHVFTV